MVEHTMRVLELFAGSSAELRLKDISAQAHVGSASTFRILRTLANLGYVNKDVSTGRYRMASKMRELATCSQFKPGMHQVARPYLEHLREQFNETVSLAVLQDAEIVYLDILESTRAFRMAEAVGSRVPVHATALGKAITAHVSQKKLDEILCRCPWTRFTSRTITKPRDFVKALAKVRRQAYGRDNEETEQGACSFASAIQNGATGDAVAGISVSGPTCRLLAKRDAIIKELRLASSAIGQALHRIG